MGNKNAKIYIESLPKIAPKHIDKIAKGNLYNNGHVEIPDKIISMSITD